MKQGLLRVSCLLGLLCALAGGVRACECRSIYHQPITKVEIERAVQDSKDYNGKPYKAVVFAGTVVGEPQVPTIRGGIRVRITTLRVSKMWKGPAQRFLELTDDKAIGGCEYSYDTGKEYLVYAENQAGTITTDTCTPTKPLTEAKADLTFLGAPVYEPNPLPLLLAAIGATLALGAGGLCWWRKRSAMTQRSIIEV